MKQRIDLLLVEKNLAESRNKAQSKIRVGKVFADGVRIDKPSELVDSDAEIFLQRDEIEFVSRAGFKLQHAIENFRIDLQDKIAVDVGASTGGFTDCMLQHGAKKIYAVDVGTNQLAEKLKTDSRVVSLEQVNFRHVDKEIFNDDRIDFVSIDVSFISLEKILPVVFELFENAEVVALIKPQFEVGKNLVGKNGIVKNANVRKKAVENVENFARNLGFKILGRIDSPITGSDGNVEYLIYLGRW